jgi:hypothetical protein
MRRRGAAAAVTVLVVTLIVSWATPRLSAHAASWLESVPVRGKTIKVADELAVQQNGARLQRAAPADAPAMVTTDAGFTCDMVGVLLRVPNDALPASLHVSVRTSLDGVRWSDWWTLALDVARQRGSVESRSDAISDPAWVGPSRYLQYRIGAMADRGFPGDKPVPRCLRRAPGRPAQWTLRVSAWSSPCFQFRQPFRSRRGTHQHSESLLYTWRDSEDRL